MIPICHLDRRHFLQQFGLGIVSLCSGMFLASAQPVMGVGPVERIVSLSPSRKSARRMGCALLETYDQRISTHSLLRSILGDDWRTVLATVDDGPLRHRLEARRREDFAAERVVMFDGWVLAQSEVDFCILSALA